MDELTNEQTNEGASKRPSKERRGSSRSMSRTTVTKILSFHKESNLGPLKSNFQSSVLRRYTTELQRTLW